jgi:energy-converting hydrogenase Eha subunit A
MTPRDVVLAYPTWIITLGVTAVMTWALGPSSRSADQLIVDLIRGVFSTATGLALAGLWWHVKG